MKTDLLAYRHIGINEKDEKKMLEKIGVATLDELIDRVENDVNWYTEAQKFMPSDGEINEVVKYE